jgi:para-nitrobenzyl esterase
MSMNRRRFVQASAALLSAHGLILPRASAAEQEFVTAGTAFGKIRGEKIRGVNIFKGVPYGASTTGANRFMPPRDPARWANVRDALQYGPSTPQSDPAQPAGNRRPESEDCLVLNVWTPALDGRKRPVMFWCHGGGFRNGSGSEAMLDGTNLAIRGDVVVVTVNHRLNVLGFAYLAELGGADFAQSGDAGMLDLVHALEWVKHNIAGFGGDPGMVTIFGQSGGGRKVGTLLAMPSAKGLFHRAIIESGPTIRVVDTDAGTRVASKLMSALGLRSTQVRELQTLPVDKVMAAYFAVSAGQTTEQMTEGFAPAMDGKVIPQHPFDPKASAVSADVPLMIGFTRTELTLLLRGDRAAFSLDDAGMRGRVKAIIGESAGTVIDVYRRANPGASPSDIFFLIASDNNYGAPIMKIEERRAALGRAPVYAYYFRWETPIEGGRLKSPHTIEIPFAFDNVKIAASLTGGGADAMALADRVSDTWIAFARTGDPNTRKLPAWPKYDAANRQTMVINNESRVVNDPIREQRIAMFSALKLA